MKKSNTITMSVLVAILVVISLYIGITGRTSLRPNPNNNSQQSSGSPNVNSTEGIGNTENTEIVAGTEDSEATENTESTEEEETTKPSNRPSNITASMDTALFIGDSRTVGIREYSGLKEADYFAEVSTTVFGIVHLGTKIDIPGVGKVTIGELLDQKKYDKIYIMLGINEAGDAPSVIAANTKKLVDLIQEKQPDAVIFIMANLYVSKSYQEKNAAFLTSNMKAINSAQGALANNENIFYMDSNFMFVDENENLSMDYSGDGCHLKAKHYKPWIDWIISQTKSLLGL